MAPIADTEIERVLVVTAHPDDVDFGSGGTVAAWTNLGIHVSYCICTNGDQGGEDAAVPREEMPRIRQAEQRAAGEALGVSDIHFLNYRDGWLAPTFELRRDIVRVIRQVRPDRMVIQSPERNWNRIHASHPDHMAAGEAAIQAVYPDARNAFAWPELLSEEGLAPWTVREVWVAASDAADHWVDITDTFPRKIEALKQHVSQTGHVETLEEMVRGWGALNAEKGGLPLGRISESYKIVSTL